jgi:hypothetical protein
MHLVVIDIEAAEAHLRAHGADVGELHHFVDGRRTPGVDPEHRRYNSFLPFTDPDGNTWVVQEVPA